MSTPQTVALTPHLTHLRLRDLAATHIRSRQRAVERLAGFLSRDAATATTDELLDYVARMPRTTNRSKYAEISHLACFFAWAHLHGHIPSDPCRMVPRPKLSRLLPRPMSEADVAVAIENAPPRVRLWLVLAGFEGLRACEIASLDRSDVLDNAAMPALIAHGKGRKDRIVPLGERALAELRAYGLPSRGPLFLRMDRRPGRTSAHRVSVVANDYLHGMGITDTLHSLRHRFATLTYDATRDILVVGALLGHVDPASTAGYAAYSDARAQAAVRALDPIY
jgi:site-specific recombinase XerD